MQLNTFGKGYPLPCISGVKIWIVMKLVAVLIFISFLQVSAKSYAQKISLKKDNATLEEVLNAIHQQTGYLFLYDNRALKGLNGIDVNVKNASLQETLDQCIARYSLGYLIEDKTILVFPKEAAREFLKPSRTVKGAVTDNNGNPLSGVTVRIQNSNIGTISDQNGNFSIEVAGDQTVLQFSYLGFLSQDVMVGQHSVLSIEMHASTNNLDQLVVVGYGTQEKKDLTGAIDKINTDKITSLPVANVGEAIQGRAAGVQIIASGPPGSNVTFRIRGTGTINNSDPLLVVDGVPVDIPLNTFNMNDVASIQILKDASAAAIYGSRGANGVVIITTKKGKKTEDGRGNLSFNFFTAFQQATHVVKMLNASQFASLNNDMLENNNQPLNPAYAHPDTLGAGTDWLGNLFRTAPMQNYSLSYSGGSDMYNYYVSGSFMDQQGIVINTGYKRYTVQFNSQATVFPWLKFGNNLSLEHDKKYQGSYDIRNTMAANPVQPVYNPDGTYSGPEGNPKWYGDIRNPVGTATIDENRTLGYNVLGSVYGEATIIPGLKFKTTGGIQAMFWDNRSWAPKYDWKPIPQPSSYLEERFNKSITLLWDNYFTYDKLFDNDHHLTILAGTSAQNNRTDYINGHINGFASDLTQQLDNGTDNPVIGGNGSEWALLSFMGRVNYAYKDKYLVTATIRRDGSSRFGKGNRWGTFPSASAAWRISKEPFFENVSFVNDLKLRLGYGVTGNQNIGNYSFASVYQTAQYNFNGQIVSAVFPHQMPNPNVRWETVKQSNIGIDATLFDSRVEITANAYIKNTSDMLVPAVVPIATGFSDIDVPFINAGKVRNKGIELNISTENLTGSFLWSTNFNISYNQNEIISLNGTVPLHNGSIGLNYYLGIDQAGHPINEFYGYVMQGIFQNEKEVAMHSIQQNGGDPYNRTSPGDIAFLDINNDGVINDEDRTFIGDPSPRFIFAMNNSFSYKGFDLSVFLQGIQGNRIFNANNIFQEGMSVGQNQTIRTLKRWTGPGTSNSMPRAIFNDPNENTRPSTRFVEDGSYLRIKNITLGYSLPHQLLQRIKFSEVRIYISCQNLYTFTKYSGFDPEVPANGIDYSVYPVTRTISVGLNLNL